MRVLEDLSNLVDDLAEQDCRFAVLADSIDCFTQFAKGQMDLDDCCLSCRAKEIAQRENNT